MLKYSVEGENNMPFELSQLIVVSTAEGLDPENKLEYNIMQNNDLYLYIAKNKNYKETEIIKKITINDIKIESTPKVGEITIYRPSKAEDKIYEYSEEYIVNNEITYEGSELPNAKELKIANQGGIIILRFSNNKIRKIYIKR